MGIKGLMKLLDEEAPGCYRETEKKTYFARTVAIDASMQLYQFLIQVRSAGDGGKGPSQMLMNEEGEITSHLQGFFNRSTNLLESGIKPVFVFDGAPPTLKSGELAKRREVKAKAEAELKEAELRVEEGEIGDEEAAAAAVADMDKAAKRTVHVTKEHNEEAKRLLRLMGIAVVEAPCEAEAQCAALAKAGKVYATATEDMDALTFATPILLRKLTMPESRKEPVLEIHMDKVLGPDGLNITYDQFVDLCILCGCDYCDSIRGVGSKTALKLIREHGNIETILTKIDRTKYPVPESLETGLEEIRGLFKNPVVTPADTVNIAFSAPDKEGLLEFLVKEKGFNAERVQKVIDRLVKSRTGGSQLRLDAFFKPVPGSTSATSSSAGFKKPAGGAAASGKDSKKRGGDSKGASPGNKKSKKG